MPTRFGRSLTSPTGLSWVKDTAHAEIRVLRAIAAILAESGRHRVDVLIVRHPGYVVYEDAVQVVAEPFASTITG